MSSCTPQKMFLSTIGIGLLSGIVGAFVFVNFFMPSDVAMIGDPARIVEEHSYIEESVTIDAIKKASPSVVSIVATKDLTIYYRNPFPFNDFFDNDPFFKQFFNIPQSQPQQKEPETRSQKVGGGTGFIVTKDGMILTNKHVVSDTEASYTVILKDGTEYDAEVLSVDPYNDIAVLQAVAKEDGPGVKDLPVAKLGDSDKLQVGQRVLAIGNALAEYENTVTSGIISAKERQITASGGGGFTESLTGLLQTDAAINPGNSGGPLVNLAGEVIGMNVAIAANTNNIGFAIPINDVKPVFESVKQYGKIVRPVLGVRHMMLTREHAKELKINVDHGALLIDGENPGEFAVIPGSGADKAGLKEKDVILQVDGEDVTIDHTLQNAIRDHQPGDKVKLNVWRSGDEIEVEVELGKSTDFE